MTEGRRAWLATVLLVAASAAAADVELNVRDSLSGAPLNAELELREFAPGGVPNGTSPLIRKLDIVDGRAMLRLGAGQWNLEVRAAQYAPLRTSVIDDASQRDLTVLLDPLQVPAETAATQAMAARNPARVVLHGYVREASDAHAIVGARIRIGEVTALSDQRGYFELDAGLAGDALQAVPRRVQVQAAGHADYELRDAIVGAGATRLLVLLGDAPVVQHSELRPLLRQDPRADTPWPDSGSAAAIGALPVRLAPPTTIRVGFNDAGCTSTCCGTSCSNTCTMSLETYVKRGLDSEWIASWNTHSLRAGSLAYRSYGAWHVLHPRTANYDICSNACCQVNDASTAGSTDAAAARTPGLLLTRDGTEAYRAEFSAENNSWDDPADGLSCSNVDLSCGNGYAGSPSAGWPCLADAVGSGRGCFGHGRGMSQWGTQRWAIHATTPKSWKWISNHYYNDNANESGAGSGQRTATITSPLALTSIAAVPATLDAGASFSIQLGVDNLAGAAHSHLLMGASLYKSGIGYISDPLHDAPLSAVTGGTAASRAFDVPAGTAAGVYDLIVAVYLDVDENGLISSEDLAMTSLTRNQHVAIGNDRIYAHGFEP